jgi:hypothetical protein
MSQEKPVSEFDEPQKASADTPLGKFPTFGIVESNKTTVTNFLSPGDADVRDGFEENLEKISQNSDLNLDEEYEILYELRKLELERRLRRVRSGIHTTNPQLSESQTTVIEADRSEGLGTGIQYMQPGTSKPVVSSGAVNFQNGVSVLPDTSQFIAQALARVDLPRVELAYFDGDPIFYHQFIRQFETQVESRVNDPGQRLSFLIHYTKGRAKRAIEGCVVLPPQAGYDRARNILKELFGKSHSIGRALISDLTQGAPLRATADDLIEFSIKLENCEMTLMQMGRQADLNSETNLERIVTRLPSDVQRQ